MLPEEFHDLLGVPARSFQFGDAVQKVSWRDTAKRTRPNFVRLPYTEECSSMGCTEILFGLFGGLPAYGTIHDDCVFLDHPLYFHAFIPESPSRNCACGFEGSAPGRGASFLIVPIRALFPVVGRFCIYNGRFPVRRNEQEPQEKRASKRVLAGPSLNITPSPPSTSTH